MNFIIFDLEATCWDGSPKDKPQEIIEIGALKINRYGELEGTYSQLVRPILYPVLSVYCRELTHIDQIEVNRASTFPTVIDDFLDWAEVDYEEYLLCSWGGKDKTMLKHDCSLHHLDTDWVENHINIKRQYHEMKRLHRPRGLKKTVVAEGFEFTGEQHRALTDAENLAKVFLKYLDLWQF